MSHIIVVIPFRTVLTGQFLYIEKISIIITIYASLIVKKRFISWTGDNIRVFTQILLLLLQTLDSYSIRQY